MRVVDGRLSRYQFDDHQFLIESFGLYLAVADELSGFEDCLADWDPASNAMGWQWSAGSGPDATPYFRVFNPVTQLEKFDPQHVYADSWIAEGKSNPSEQALSYFEAVPRSWSMTPGDPYPHPVVGVDVGRRRALDAYQSRDF